MYTTGEFHTIPNRTETVSPAHAYRMERISNGMRLELPAHVIGNNRAITTGSSFYADVTSAGHNDISVSVKHFIGYRDNEQRFELTLSPEETAVEETEDDFILTAGDMRVSFSRKKMEIRFEALEEDPFTGRKEFRTLTTAYANYKRNDVRRRDDEPSYYANDWKPSMTGAFSIDPGETYYGLGERFSPLVRNGQTQTLFNEDVGTGSDKTYINVPLLVSSRHYAIFIDHTTKVRFDIGSGEVRFVNATVPGEEIRFHIIYGKTPADIMEAYTGLTGRPALPPEWSFGYWFSSCSGTTWNADKIEEMLDGMEKYGIPVDVFHIDGPWLRPNMWCDFVPDPYVFPDMKKALDSFHKRGIKLCLWINPYVGQGNAMFDEGVEKGYFLQRADGHGVKQVDYWMPGLAIVDLTNPEAYSWWQGKVKSMMGIGIDTFKTDFGEMLPFDVKYHNGMSPESMHSYYSYLYNKCVFEILEKERGTNDAVVFGRSGTAGSQKYPCNWSGDPTASYQSMAETLRGGLSYAMSGFSFWSHDIGGFGGWPTPDLYKRWVQFGMFTSHTRTHSWGPYKVPWAFDDESVDVLREFDVLKCRLMPYIFENAVMSHKHGTPLLRPMFFDFPEDITCRYLDLQYMFGPSLLIAPIFNDRSEADFFLPYLPDGRKWINIIDGQILDGGKQYRQKYGYHSMPAFIKGNSILPFGADKGSAEYDYTDGTAFRWYLPSEAKAPEDVIIPDRNGNTVCTVRAYCSKDGYVFTAEGPLTNAKAEVYLENGKVLCADFSDGKAVVKE